MSSNNLIRQLLGEKKDEQPPKVESRRLVEELMGLKEGTINIHIHNGKDDPEVQTSTDELAPELIDDVDSDEVQDGDRPPMPPPQINAPGAKNYVFKVKRDSQGRVAEIYATKLS